MSTAERAPKTAVQTWSVDPARSTVEFSAKGFWGLATANGRFDRFAGSYAVGPGGPRIELTIDADSLDTGNRMRDKHLRSEDFFGIAEHPQVRFTSTRVRAADGGTLHVEGDLEAAGKVVPVAFDATVEKVGGGVEIEATTSLDHRRFGMSGGALGMIRPPVTLRVRAYLADIRS